VMPGGITGTELARKLRARFPELPILLTTGYSEQVSATQGFPVLQKPYEMSALASAVNDLLKLEIAVS
jgi:CheY-like chemotaxis protein